VKGWFWLFLLLSGSMVSCAPFSKDIMRQVDPTLIFDEIQRNPQPYVGRTVLWGGIIIETTNRDSETYIKVRKTDLDYEKRPMNVDRSAGRFIVRYNGFLDSAIYREGRETTVAGEVAGIEVQPIGNTNYRYPVILAKAIRLWQPPIVYPYYPPWYWGPYPWGYPYPYWYYRPYWW